MAHLAHS
ncbi:hypothetical protein Nmel_008985 [Mimus melanotis]